MRHKVIDWAGRIFRSLPNFRGKSRLASILLHRLIQSNDPELLVPLRNGNGTIICRLKDWIPWNIFIHGNYISETVHENYMLEKARNANVILDIGANIGYYSVQFSSVSSGKIYSFEPMQYQHAVLLRNLELNGRQNVTVLKQIVSDTSDAKRIYFSGTENTGASSMTRESVVFEDVESLTIDSFCENHGIDAIDLIKIDVEGHEMSVLRGMKRCLEHHRVKHLFIEVSIENLERSGNSAKDLCDYLASKGYRSYSLATGQPERYHADKDESLAYFTVSEEP